MCWGLGISSWLSSLSKAEIFEDHTQALQKGLVFPCSAFRQIFVSGLGWVGHMALVSSLLLRAVVHSQQGPGCHSHTLSTGR